LCGRGGHDLAAAVGVEQGARAGVGQDVRHFGCGQPVVDVDDGLPLHVDGQCYSVYCSVRAAVAEGRASRP
jgi:hypothetical protein